MFFENENLTFNILEVRYLNQSGVNMQNSGRSFSSLSFRLCADTLLRTEAKEHRLGDGAVTFVPAGVDYSRVSRLDEMIIVRFDSLSYRGRDIESFVPRDVGAISSLFGRMLDTWSAKAPGYKYRLTAIMYDILAECYAENYERAPVGSPIAKSVEYMLSSYTEPGLTVGALARRSFMSEVYFRRLFKAEYGTSPQKYIIDLRIKHAAGLISTGYYSLSEAAAMSGYTDYKYFSAEFKRLMGVSPSEYSRAITGAISSTEGEGKA